MALLQSLPRRKRHLLFTIALSAFFFVGAGAAVWVFTSSAETYRPGGAIDGLTSELERNLPADYPRVTFADVTAQAGIDFRQFMGRRTSQLPEDMGSGAAWGDYDGDGDLDLFVANVAGPITMSPEELERSTARDVLYENRGDGTFVEVGESAGVARRAWRMAAAWADFDNDGHLDLVVTGYGRNTLYRNRGNGAFEDVSASSGIGEEEGFWAGASWGDYDRDGLVDLYITGYVQYTPETADNVSLQYDVETPAAINPSSFLPERNLLYRNLGGGRFEEVALRSGVENVQGRSLSAAWVDLDEDGWPDLYVANDVSDNVLYRNLGDGTFEEISHRALVADYRGAMGIAVGDWDGDTDVDLFLTHWIAQENALYNNTRAGSLPTRPLQFMDVADRFGLGQIALDFIGWGTSFLDYDNDGRLDLFVTNGSTFQHADSTHLLKPMSDQLFWNRSSDEGFFDVSSVSGSYFSRSLVGRGAAFADYDDDGDVDVFIVNHGGAPALLRNDGGNASNWLDVALVGTSSNRSAFGARLRLVAGDLIQVRQIGSQSSYCSQNALVEHFGLGGNTVVDSLIVHWPSGHVDRMAHIPPNQKLRLVEGRPASREAES